MEHKKLIIGGGIAAVVALGVVVVRARSKSSTQSDNSQSDNSASLGSYYMSGTIPSAVGYTSSDAQTPSQSDNSGSTDTGGGFDMSALMEILKGNQSTQQQQVQAGQNTSDSAVLAGLFGNVGGSATVSHSTNGTTINVSKANDDPYSQIISQQYQEVFGRAPDAGGMAFYKNALLNGGLSATSLHDQLVNSQEYKDKTKPASATPTNSTTNK